jgi:hypothetical protein
MRMPEQDKITGRFLMGGNGGPGRPRGSRNRLGEQFLEALADDFHMHGRQAIVASREAEPTAYLRIVAGLLPKELLVRKDPIDELSDQEIIDVLDALKELVPRGSDRPHPAPH